MIMFTVNDLTNEIFNGIKSLFVFVEHPVAEAFRSLVNAISCKKYG
jgi:hypothetical protein